VIFLIFCLRADKDAIFIPLYLRRECQGKKIRSRIFALDLTNLLKDFYQNCLMTITSAVFEAAKVKETAQIFTFAASAATALPEVVVSRERARLAPVPLKTFA
jgi:hypothetical protein